MFAGSCKAQRKIAHPSCMSSSSMKARTNSHLFLLFPLHAMYFSSSPAGRPCGLFILRPKALYHTRRSLMSRSLLLIVLIFSRCSGLKELASQQNIEHYSMQLISYCTQGTRMRRPSAAIVATADAVGGEPLPSLARVFVFFFNGLMLPNSNANKMH